MYVNKEIMNASVYKINICSSEKKACQSDRLKSLVISKPISKSFKPGVPFMGHKQTQ